jgi:hypothetical protein
VLNLQNQDELPLNNVVKLATIEARSREEAKCSSKIYATEVAPEDSDDPQIDALHQNSNYNMQSTGRYQSQPARKNNQQRLQNKSWRQNNNQGNNSNRNGQSASFARCRITDRRNVAKGSRPTNLA